MLEARHCYACMSDTGFVGAAWSEPAIRLRVLEVLLAPVSLCEVESSITE